MSSSRPTRTTLFSSTAAQILNTMPASPQPLSLSNSHIAAAEEKKRPSPLKRPMTAGPRRPQREAISTTPKEAPPLKPKIAPLQGPSLDLDDVLLLPDSALSKNSKIDARSSPSALHSIAEETVTHAEPEEFARSMLRESPLSPTEKTQDSLVQFFQRNTLFSTLVEANQTIRPSTAPAGGRNARLQANTTRPEFDAELTELLNSKFTL